MAEFSMSAFPFYTLSWEGRCPWANESGIRVFRIVSRLEEATDIGTLWDGWCRENPAGSELLQVGP